MSATSPAGAGPRAPRRDGTGTPWAVVTGQVVRAVVRHPVLLLAGMAAAARLARPGWWRRWPPLPVPGEELWRFRMETAYGGGGDAVPTDEDVTSFLVWCRDMRRWRRT